MVARTLLTAVIMMISGGQPVVMVYYYRKIKKTDPLSCDGDGWRCTTAAQHTTPRQCGRFSKIPRARITTYVSKTFASTHSRPPVRRRTRTFRQINGRAGGRRSTLGASAAAAIRWSPSPPPPPPPLPTTTWAMFRGRACARTECPLSFSLNLVYMRARTHTHIHSLSLSLLFSHAQHRR